MILDSIAHRSCYEGIDGLKEVLAYMASVQNRPLPSSRIDLLEDRAYVQPVSFTSKPLEQCRYEAHRRWIDVHFIVSGTEKIIVSPLCEVHALTEFSAEKDIGFYEGTGGTACILCPGDFLVCFPQDAHKVAIAPEQPGLVQKLVGKIRV